MMRSLPAILLLLLGLSAPLFAAIDEYSFDSEEQTERFRTLIAELRCPKCLNSNLAGSDAPIAADLRAEIFRQLQQGRSDDEIVAYLQERYGDFILYRPPLSSGTALLWFGPLALLLAGFVVLRRMLHAARAASSETELTPSELQRLNAMLDGDKEQNSR
jgi:cytochrome c-type biogenesis protein CcmH